MNTLTHLNSLRRYVRNHPLPQAKLAAEIGVSYSWLNKFARGEAQNPCASTLAKLENHARRRRARR